MDVVAVRGGVRKRRRRNRYNPVARRIVVTERSRDEARRDPVHRALRRIWRKVARERAERGIRVGDRDVPWHLDYEALFGPGPYEFLRPGDAPDVQVRSLHRARPFLLQLDDRYRAVHPTVNYHNFIAVESDRDLREYAPGDATWVGERDYETLAVRLPARATRLARELLGVRLDYPQVDEQLVLTHNEQGTQRIVRVVRSPSLGTRRRTGYVIVAPAT